MIHRLLCCSDTHGLSPPTVDEAGVVAWLHAGDVIDGPTSLGDDDRSDPALDPLRARAAGWFAARRVPVLLVPGNHDVTDDLWAFRRGDDVSGRVVRVADRLLVAGVGWHGERHFELPLESDLRPVCDAVRRQARRLVMPKARLVLLTHYPPRYPDFRTVPNDSPAAGVWFDAVRDLADDLRPVAVVQGHVHHWFGTSHPVLMDDGTTTLVVSPGPDGAELAVDVESGEVRLRWLPRGTAPTSGDESDELASPAIS